MATNADNGENGGDDNNHRIDYDKALQILEIELRSDVEEEIENLLVSREIVDVVQAQPVILLLVTKASFVVGPTSDK